MDKCRTNTSNLFCTWQWITCYKRCLTVPCPGSVDALVQFSLGIYAIIGIIGNPKLSWEYYNLYAETNVNTFCIKVSSVPLNHFLLFQAYFSHLDLM